MLKKLSRSSKVVKDLKMLEKEILKIKNDRARSTGLGLLKKLQDQTNIIDSTHSIFSVSDINNEKIRENIETLAKIRQEIAKLIKDSKS